MNPMTKSIIEFKMEPTHGFMDPEFMDPIKLGPVKLDENSCRMRYIQCLLWCFVWKKPEMDTHNTIYTPPVEPQYKDTIPFVPPIHEGYVVKVYDGDTITIASKLPYKESPLYRFQVRLNGIDCPEIRGENEFEKKVAQMAKLEISNLILNKHVTLKNVGTEKYGRILADVYIEDIHLNGLLLERRLAVKYEGGTKVSPKSWTKYNETGCMD